MPVETVYYSLDEELARMVRTDSDLGARQTHTLSSPFQKKRPLAWIGSSILDRYVCESVSPGRWLKTAVKGRTSK